MSDEGGAYSLELYIYSPNNVIAHKIRVSGYYDEEDARLAARDRDAEYGSAHLARYVYLFHGILPYSGVGP